MGRLLRLVAATVLSAGVLAVPSAGAAPDDAAAPGGGACPAGSGVTVIVDFGSLDGGTQVRCAPGDPGSGLAALSAAGFSYSFVPGVPGFVCTIDSRPDPCNGAPAHAYWGYFHAERGGTWRYSNVGAGQRDPEPGDVEGWAFGNGDRRPSASPPAAPATTTTTARSPTSRPAPSPAPTSGATTTLPSGSDQIDATGTPESSPTTSDGTSTTTTEEATTTSTSAPPTTGDRRDDPADEEDEEALLTEAAGQDSGPGATGALLGVVVLAAIAGGAVWEFRRRRPPG